MLMAGIQSEGSIMGANVSSLVPTLNSMGRYRLVSRELANGLG